MQTIRNIIFDLGAVILDIDYQLTADAFKKIGLREFDEIYSKKKQQHFFDDFETGKMSNADFRKEIKTFLPVGISDSDIDSAWNAMLKTIPAERVNWLKEIRKDYRIFLLSNTNKIHIAAFQKILEKDFEPDLLEKLFEKTYYSCEIGMRKPDIEIFDFVISENSLMRSETLFIDDSPQHVEGAKKSGLHALHLQNEMTVEQLLAEVI